MGRAHHLFASFRPPIVGALCEPRACPSRQAVFAGPKKGGSVPFLRRTFLHPGGHCSNHPITKPCTSTTHNQDDTFDLFLPQSTCHCRSFLHPGVASIIRAPRLANHSSKCAADLVHPEPYSLTTFGGSQHAFAHRAWAVGKPTALARRAVHKR